MSDALETAVIAMVLQGDALASQKANQVTSALSSAERAGRAAEAAAKSAQSAVSTLGEQVTQATEKMHVAIRVAERLASVAGVESPALGALGQGFSTFNAVNRLTAPLNAIVPGASLALGAAAGLFTGISSYEKSEADEQKKADELAAKIAEKVTEERQRKEENSLANQMLRQAAMNVFDNIRGGSGPRQ